MATVGPISPLMQPVIWNDKEYKTSHYFHQDYIENSKHGGKYKKHENFIRLLQSIEAYHIYLNQEDIVEIAWERVKAEVTPNLSKWRALFQAVGYRTLYLLNATAQAALSHHLDDELSQQLSVAINTTIARQVHLTPEQQIRAILMPAYGPRTSEYPPELFREWCRVYGHPIPEGSQHSPACRWYFHRDITSTLPEAAQHALLDQTRNPYHADGTTRTYRHHQLLRPEMKREWKERRVTQILFALSQCEDGDGATYEAFLAKHDRKNGIVCHLIPGIRAHFRLLDGRQLSLFEEIAAAD